MNDQEASLWIVIMLYYEGPWSILEGALLSVDPKTVEIIRKIKPGSRREKLADWCGKMDKRWRNRYARKGKMPSNAWRRRPIEVTW